MKQPTITLIYANAQPTQEQERQMQRLGNYKKILAHQVEADEVIRQTHDADILIAGPAGVKEISATLLQGLKKLKLVCLLTVGTNWVDLRAAKNLGITISTIKGANAESVAEHSWAMILDLAKRVTELHLIAQTSHHYNVGDFKGKEVFGKTLGVIGLGEIGTKVARIGQAFQMKILGVNRSRKNIPGVKQVELDMLLKESDVIVVCTPLTAETQNLIGDKELSLMKKGAILVNCAREPIVNKEAVLAALKNEKLYGYGVETDLMVPIGKDDPYLSHSRVLVTPHNAYNTEDAERKSFDTVIANIKAFLRGTPQNVAT